MLRPKLAIVLLASLAVLAADGFAAQAPNVIVVMTDDQGYGEFSHNGNPITSTPNIDQLAAEGIRLTDFHVSPMCTPTRGQLMTGLDAFRNHALNVSSGRTLLGTEFKTMADLFASAGFATGLFGKWHLGDNYPFRPEDRGFDEALWFPSSHIHSVPDHWNNDYFDDTYIHNGIREQRHGYCTDVFFGAAIDWMKSRRREQPFFAYIALNAAHSPWFVPDQYRAPIRQAIEQNPQLVNGMPDQQREDLISFLAMGANIDENVGRLDAFLEQSGLRENTLVVFLTDNGSTMGDRYFNAGMRGHKTQLWEGGHRVPCLIRWPAGELGPSRSIDRLTHVQDLLPTLADLSGVNEIPDDLDGISLAPILRDPTASIPDRMLVINYSRMPFAANRRGAIDLTRPSKEGACVLWGPWRLLQNQRLYNVDLDPHQDRDVAPEHPEVLEKMRSHLDRWWDSVKEGVDVPQRVIIGDDAENPMMLTACEWLDVFVDQQKQVRRGERKNGSWHLRVAQSGDYRIELRRWPRESGLKVDEGTPRLKVTDGIFQQGVALPIHRASLRIGDKTVDLEPEQDNQCFVAEVPLQAGPIEMQGTFLDESGAEVCGAYYAYIHRH